MMLGMRTGPDEKEGSSSFLKKRTKKLLLVQYTRMIRRTLAQAIESFLVLFFKKELLPSTQPGRR
jgi:hypothetical protein